MGRLIDVDDFKRKLDSQQLMEHLCKVGQKNSQNLLFALEQVIDIQPTAYDVDKVVEQLEAYSDADEAEQLGTVPIVGFADAIKIVKAGGNIELPEHSKSQGD